jgi:L-threonylcarbamoyladenylate synthase
MSNTAPASLRLADDAAIVAAAAILRRGGLVAFPTETVYGVGANATNGDAVAALFATKRRPRFNPLIIHSQDESEAARLGVLSAMARDLAQEFWPGALTLVVPRHPRCPVSLLACAGLETIALRVPSHPIAVALIRQAGVPIAAPSANVSGRVTATSAAHVFDEFGDSIDLILDGGAAPLGLESTVVGFEDGQAVLLRPGAITRQELEEVVGSLRKSDTASVRSPGQLASHYAPRALIRMNATSVRPDDALLAFGPPSTCPVGARATLNLSIKGDLREAAANLFAMLRALDETGAREVAVMTIPETGLGEAINDRLRRAAAPRSAGP